MLVQVPTSMRAAPFNVNRYLTVPPNFSAAVFARVDDGGNYGWPYCNPNPDTPAGFVNMPFDRDVQNNADGSRLDCAAATRISQGI